CAWRSIERFDSAKSVKAWLWKIARNCLLTELQRRRGTLSAVAVDQLDNQAAVADDGEISGVLKDFCEVMDRIPQHPHALLFMSVENDSRYGPEAAKKLAFASPTSVRVTRNRLVKKIREEMQRRGHFAGTDARV